MCVLLWKTTLQVMPTDSGFTDCPSCSVNLQKAYEVLSGPASLLQAISLCMKLWIEGIMLLGQGQAVCVRWGVGETGAESPTRPRKVDFCLTRRNKFSEEIHTYWQNERLFFVNECLSRAFFFLAEHFFFFCKWVLFLWLPVSGFMQVVLVFQVASGQSFCSCPYLVCLRALPGGAHISQSRRIPEQGFLGGLQDY